MKTEMKPRQRKASRATQPQQPKRRHTSSQFDDSTLSLNQNPTFRRLLDEAEAGIEAGNFTTHEDLLRELGLGDEQPTNSN